MSHGRTRLSSPLIRVRTYAEEKDGAFAATVESLALLRREKIGDVAFQFFADEIERIEADVLLVHLDPVERRLR